RSLVSPPGGEMAIDTGIGGVELTAHEPGDIGKVPLPYPREGLSPNQLRPRLLGPEGLGITTSFLGTSTVNPHAAHADPPGEGGRRGKDPILLEQGVERGGVLGRDHGKLLERSFMVSPMRSARKRRAQAQATGQLKGAVSPIS